MVRGLKEFGVGDAGETVVSESRLARDFDICDGRVEMFIRVSFSCIRQLSEQYSLFASISRSHTVQNDGNGSAMVVY